MTGGNLKFPPDYAKILNIHLTGSLFESIKGIRIRMSFLVLSVQYVYYAFFHAYLDGEEKLC